LLKEEKKLPLRLIKINVLQKRNPLFWRLGSLEKISLLCSVLFFIVVFIMPYFASKEIPDRVQHTLVDFDQYKKPYFSLVTQYVHVTISESVYDELVNGNVEGLILGVDYFSKSVNYFKYNINGNEKMVMLVGVGSKDVGLMLVFFTLLLQLYTVLRIDPFKEHIFYNGIFIFSIVVEFLYWFTIHFLVDVYL